VKETFCAVLAAAFGVCACLLTTALVLAFKWHRQLVQADVHDALGRYIPLESSSSLPASSMIPHKPFFVRLFAIFLEVKMSLTSFKFDQINAQRKSSA
jgi:hypothetical protein